MISRGLTDKSLLTGLNFLAAYISEYAKGDVILCTYIQTSNNNLI
jgi:hypothetical protein